MNDCSYLVFASKNFIFTEPKTVTIALALICCCLVIYYSPKNFGFESSIAGLPIKRTSFSFEKYERQKNRFPVIPEEEKHDKWIVITSINYPTSDVKKLAKIPGWKMVMVGDTKSPKDWRLRFFSLRAIFVAYQKRMKGWFSSTSNFKTFKIKTRPFTFWMIYCGWSIFWCPLLRNNNQKI